MFSTELFVQTLIAGIMIGGIVISLYMPLFSMIAKLAG